MIYISGCRLKRAPDNQLRILDSVIQILKPAIRSALHIVQVGLQVNEKNRENHVFIATHPDDIRMHKKELVETSFTSESMSFK